MDFKSCNRQFYWLEISLHYDKSDKHLTIYDSYNAECAARMLKKIVPSSISDAYTTTNMMKFDISNDTQKHLLWKQYVALHYNGYTPAPVSDYINNPVFQELLLESDYFSAKSDEKSYIELRNPLAKKIRLRVWGYANGEYLYMLIDGSLTSKYRTYTIKSLDDALEA